MSVSSHNGQRPGSSDYSDKGTVDDLVDTEIAIRVASRIGQQWKWLGRAMGVEDAKLDCIQQLNRETSEMAYQLLLAWKQNVSFGATVRVLARHLKTVGRTDLANEIMKLATASETNESNLKMSHVNETGKHSPHRSGLIERYQAAPPKSKEELHANPVELDVLRKVSSSIGKEWKVLGREMGLEEHQLATIETDNRSYGREETIFQMLTVWKEQFSLKANVNILAEYIRKVGRADLAYEITAQEKTVETARPAEKIRKISLSHEMQKTDAEPKVELRKDFNSLKISGFEDSEKSENEPPVQQNDEELRRISR